MGRGMKSLVCAFVTAAAIALVGCGSNGHRISTQNQWTWVSGANAANQKGTYGTQGTTASANTPGARSNGVSWTDQSGYLWMFGGLGYDSAGTQGQLNDLWVYGSNGWTWVSGAKVVNQGGNYGARGTTASSNVPGARSNAASWIDQAGYLWMFGGYGYDSTGTLGQLNDTWVYSRNGWTWVSGSNIANQSGTYGTQGSSASSNTPGGRSNAVSWTDAYGNPWLFGGFGYDSTGALGQLNDLWVFRGRQWRWVGGSNLVNQPGIYGTQGTSGSSNVPGARSNAVSWTDFAGNLWLFGGSGFDSAGTPGQLNDLWVYGSNGWEWVSGAKIVNQKGTYGTQGTAASGNTPGARSNPVSWTDGYGNLWLLGGSGYDSAGTQGQLNDLWAYGNSGWEWVRGANVVNHGGTYGTKGTTASSSVPGARSNAVSWTDFGGNLWLFGGSGYDSASTQGQLNDLWVYQP